MLVYLTYYSRYQHMIHFNIRACLQHSLNAVFLWNFQKYSVEILYAIIDWVCLGFPK